MSYYGKYRGAVVDNIDPLQCGRLRLEVPDVLGASPSGWAEGCFSAADLLFLRSPLPVSAKVWVEFEGGDPDKPIWSGCQWLDMAMMTEPSVAMRVADLAITISEEAGLLLTTSSGETVSIGPAGVTISNGKGASVTLSGPTVTINNGALAIT
jgi:hypothetical protein